MNRSGNSRRAGRSDRTFRAIPGAILLPILAILAVPAPLPALAGPAENSEDPMQCEGELSECLEQMAARLAASGWVGLELVCKQKGSPYSVNMVMPDTPAAEAGLRAGDVLLAVDGVAIPDCSRGKLREVMRDLKPGQSIIYSIERDGEDRKVALTLEPIPADLLAKYLGMRALERAGAEKGP